MRISLIVIAALLAGCQANQDSLPDFIAALPQQTNVSVPQKNDALPQPREIIQYHHLRSPFVRAIEDKQPVVTKTYVAPVKSCQPTAAALKTGQFTASPLAELKVKGIIGTAQYRVALVASNSGEYRQIQQGDYLSRVYARVIRISTDKLYIEPLSMASASDACGILAERYLQLQ